MKSCAESYKFIAIEMKIENANKSFRNKLDLIKGPKGEERRAKLT